MMTTKKVIELAEKHQHEGNMSSSACVALQDAKHLRERGFHEMARGRALASLRYSIGVFHPDYQRATA